MALECLLAAMDGMSHAPFRSLCFEYGADGASTEMISANALARAKRRRASVMEALLLRRPEEGPLAAQIIGSDPAAMAEAARRLEALERFDAIEINMGCPARCVVGSGNGSALLRDVGRAEAVIRAVCAGARLPVRLKLRLGWDEAHIVAPELAQIAQDAGCAALILHGRTREQQYRGEVALDEMRRVRACTRLKIYANGAVRCAEDAARFAAETGADGVCIGRAALRSPWIFEDIRALARGEAMRPRDARERVDLVLRLAERLCRQKPEVFSMAEMRRASRWYLSGLTGAEDAFAQIDRTLSLADFRSILERLLDRLIQTDDMHIHPDRLRGDALDTVRR